MSNELVPFSSNDTVEMFRGHFMVPSDWASCGVVVHVSGVPRVEGGQPVALAVTEASISFCTKDGPSISVPLASIREVKVVDLTGIALPVQTPSGMINMVPPRAKGVSIKFELNPMGTIMELTLYTLSPSSAFEWMNLIQEAIYHKMSNLGQSGAITRR